MTIIPSEDEVKVDANCDHLGCQTVKPGTDASGEACFKTIVLLSGGVDSLACVHFFSKRGHSLKGVFVDYGQVAAEFECKAARQIAGRYNIELQEITVSLGECFGAGEVVGRNALLMMLGVVASKTSFSAIACGIHGGTPYYDCSSIFVNRISTIISESSDGRTQLLAPLLDWTKQEVYEYVKEEKLPVELTYSCEAGDLPECGKCLSCRDREVFGC